MKESTIRKNALYILRTEGWVCWCPPKARYLETDIFGVYDTICARSKDIRFIQWTSRSNISARVKKIKAFHERENVYQPAEVWGYDGKQFKIVHV